MWKLLIGPVLAGCAWVAGSFYGGDAEQIVRKSPDAVFAGIDQAISAVPQSGMTHFEGGTPIPYELDVDRSASERLRVKLMLDGREGAEIDVHLAPRDGGKATLLTANVHTDHAVLRNSLAGTDKAKLAYAPDWILNLTLRPVLRQLADQLEKGQPILASGGYQSRAEWESKLPPEERERVQEWRQYDAARPMVDPDEAARNYVNGGAN